MASSVRERSNQRAMDRLLAYAQGEIIGTVGIHASEGAKTHDSDSGMSTVEIAQRHEFGQGVPQRSWLRGWFDLNQDEIRAQLKSRIVTGMRNGEALGATMQGAVDWAARSVKARIRNRIPPPNSRQTLKFKSGDIPLIDTRVMIDAIKGKVR